MHVDVTFILKYEIPDVTFPYIDDVLVKGPPIRYELHDNTYETISKNPNIRRFIWEHLNDVNRILQRIKVVGGTFFEVKLVIVVLEVVIVDHTCNYFDCVLDVDRIRIIANWPPLENITQLRAFLGTAGVVRHFILDFARLAFDLTRLLRKDVSFNFDDDAETSMIALKEAIINSNAIRPIDYRCDRLVHLCVDSSNIDYDAILLQIGENGERFSSRFMFETWNARERNYSQPKIELFDLFRAMYEACIYLIELNHFFVEVDVKYIKGMINNPNLQSNATINRWIVEILLFPFTLIHILVTRHTEPDDLSKRPPHELDPPRDTDFKDWIDYQYAFFVEEELSSSTNVDSNNNISRSQSAQKADAKLNKIRDFL